MPQLTIQEAFKLAMQHQQGGRLREAEQLYRQILAHQPEHALAMLHLGVIAIQAGRPDGGVDLIRRSIALNPNYPDAHNNLGVALQSNRQVDEAIAAYQRAIVLRPNYPEAYYNLGIARKAAGQLDEAIAAYRAAIVLRPNCPETHKSLGNALQAEGQLDAAIAAYRQAIALRPDYTDAHDSLVYTLHFHPAYAARAIALEHGEWNRRHAEPLKPHIKPHPNDRDPDRRLRIGYVSPDFRNHPVGRFLLPLLENHERQGFEVFAYDNTPAPLADAMTERLRSHTDTWRSIVGLPDMQGADLIREDRIDILVDLAGHTPDNRLLIFAHKPAPVQATYLGYPNTTGLTTIDYRMSDSHADPPGLGDTLHSEQLVRLPRTNWIYQPPENGPVPDHDIVGGPITFGCFNNFAKVTEPTLALWGRILKAAPGSRLLLKAHAMDNPGVRQRARELLIKEGIDSARVELRGHEPEQGRHLAQYNQMDIALDPFPYHGTTTTCEALWMGVPVITLAGRTHVSRVGVSLLSNAGLPELVANTPEEYVQIAVGLARDPPRLKELRSTLRQRMEASPLMDAPKFARGVEAAYRQMWRTWCETRQ